MCNTPMGIENQTMCCHLIYVCFNYPPYIYIKKEQHTINYIKLFATVNINLHNTTFILLNSWHFILSREPQLVLTNSVLSCVVSMIHHLPNFLYLGRNVTATITKTVLKKLFCDNLTEKNTRTWNHNYGPLHTSTYVYCFSYFGYTCSLIHLVCVSSPSFLNHIFNIFFAFINE